MLRYLFVLITVFSYVNSADQLPISLLMSPQEEEAMGLKEAPEERRRLFEQWATHWTQKVIAHAQSYHPSIPITQWVRSWQKRPQDRPNQEELIIIRNHNGKKLELSDGSVWSISSMDQTTARWWQRNEPLVISQAKRDILRPFTVFNTVRDQKVGARQEKLASPTGKRPENDPSYFKDSIPIEHIGLQGKTISLQNQSTWKISPKHQQFVVSKWKAHDRVRIEKSSDALYQHRIINLDSGDEVLANPQ